jgi:hypothetical protein
MTKGHRPFSSKAQLTGEGQFVTLTLTRDFARHLLDELRAAPRSPAITAVGKAMVNELLALKAMPPRDYRAIEETQRTPFEGDGGDFGDTVF